MQKKGSHFTKAKYDETFLVIFKHCVLNSKIQSSQIRGSNPSPNSIREDAKKKIENQFTKAKFYEKKKKSEKNRKCLFFDFANFSINFNNPLKSILFASILGLVLIRVRTLPPPPTIALFGKSGSV